MNWLGLSPLEFLALLSGTAALAVWLYLHNRRPTLRRVATMRFWVSAQPVSQPRRRYLREPWALLAQLVFLLLLILALANLHWGPIFEGRSVVLVLDNSVWTQARPAGQSPWIDQLRRQTRQLLDSLPASDRVMLLSADTGSPAIVPFTSDRAILRRAIASLQPSDRLSDVPQALEIGRAALAGSRMGLLAYFGPGMLDGRQTRQLDAFRRDLQASTSGANSPQFLVRLVGDPGPPEDRGITRLSLRRDAAQPDRWHLLAQLKNYGDRRARVTLRLSLDGQPLGQTGVSLGPGELMNLQADVVSARGGLLRAEITPADDVPADDHAVLHLPSFRPVQVAVFANHSPFGTNLLTALSSDPFVQTEIVPPGAQPRIRPDVSIYRDLGKASRVESNSIIFVKGPAPKSFRLFRITDWNAQHPVTRWVHTRDVSVRNPASLAVQPGDVILASAPGKPPVPLILARQQGGHRSIIIGFDPSDSNFTQESAFPLLIGAGIEWMTHPVEGTVESFAVGKLDLPGPASRIVGPSGNPVSFAMQGSDVVFLAAEPGIYQVSGPGGETPVAVNLPVLPSERWTPTSAESAAPYREPAWPMGWDLWRWLAVLAIFALWLEWLLFYSRPKGWHAKGIPAPPEQPESMSLRQNLPPNPEQPETHNPRYVTK